MKATPPAKKNNSRVISQNSSISVGKRGIAAQTVGDGNVLVTGASVIT
jgi:hypothetical protein